jgi:hypothetical protein
MLATRLCLARFDPDHLTRQSCSSPVSRLPSPYLVTFFTSLVRNLAVWAVLLYALRTMESLEVSNPQDHITAAVVNRGSVKRAYGAAARTSAYPRRAIRPKGRESCYVARSLRYDTPVCTSPSAPLCLTSTLAARERLVSPSRCRESFALSFPWRRSDALENLSYHPQTSLTPGRESLWDGPLL